MVTPCSGEGVTHLVDRLAGGGAKWLAPPLLPERPHTVGAPVVGVHGGRGLSGEPLAVGAPAV